MGTEGDDGHCVHNLEAPEITLAIKCTCAPSHWQVIILQEWQHLGTLVLEAAAPHSKYSNNGLMGGSISIQQCMWQRHTGQHSKVHGSLYGMVGGPCTCLSHP